MERIGTLCAIFLSGTMVYGWARLPGFANDGAASVAVGGIQLKREARISMEKERLTVSREKVTVEYEFLNSTDEDITTEVAFPVPPYDEKYLDASFNKRLEDFRVWVDGQETKYQTEAKAMLNGVDYTAHLQKLGVDVASLGHFDDGAQTPYSPDVEKLRASQRDELRQLGLIRDNDFMGWTVVKTYHWPQKFSAHKVLNVHHEYAPVLGFEQLQPEVVIPIPRQEKTKEFEAAIRDSCMDPSIQQTLLAAVRTQKKEEGGYIPTEWVDYILTTANTWKTPIKDFELVVERPRPKPGSPERSRWFVSFCWDGPVKRLDADHFSAHVTNFVPRRELHVAFFGID
jgi:Domain of unknown function (DUF4424)